MELIIKNGVFESMNYEAETIFYFVAIFDKIRKQYKIWLHKIGDKILCCFNKIEYVLFI